MRVRSGSGLRVSRRMMLIPYSASARRRSTASQSASVVLASATDFVASWTGRAGILTACYASAPCHLRETVSIAGHIAGASTASVGAGELAYVPVQLDHTGRTKLAHARGNRLAATVQIRAGRRTRRAQVDLVGYGQ